MYLNSAPKSFKHSCLKELTLELKGIKKRYYLMSIMLFSHVFIHVLAKTR